MNKKDLLKKIARLESESDHTTTELEYVDSLLRLVGFDDGLTTLKLAAEELAMQL